MFPYQVPIHGIDQQIILDILIYWSCRGNLHKSPQIEENPHKLIEQCKKIPARNVKTRNTYIASILHIQRIDGLNNLEHFDI